MKVINKMFCNLSPVEITRLNQLTLVGEKSHTGSEMSYLLEWFAGDKNSKYAKNLRAFIVYNGNYIVGWAYISSERGLDAANAFGIYIDSHYRNNDIASKLFDKVIYWSRKKSIEKILVRPWNKSGLAFFNKMDRKYPNMMFIMPDKDMADD